MEKVVILFFNVSYSTISVKWLGKTRLGVKKATKEFLEAKYITDDFPGQLQQPVSFIGEIWENSNKWWFKIYDDYPSACYISTNYCTELLMNNRYNMRI